MTAAAWHPDPTGRHELRYWDGSQWTEHVADAGNQSTDPLDGSGGGAAGADAGAAESSGSTAAGESAGGTDFAGSGAAEGAEAPVEEQPAAEPVAAQPAQQVAPQQAAPQQAAPQQAMPPQGQQFPPQGGQPMGQAQSQPMSQASPMPGISGELVDGRYGETTSNAPGPSLQNGKLLRVRVAEPFMARQGSMVAYQGPVSFNYQGSGAAKFLKKALTGEGLSLMRVEGQGDVFIADTAKDVHILHINNSGISINGAAVLAFSASLDYNIERVKGGSMAAGGLFNTSLRGTGWVAITTDGQPVVLNAAEAPTFADANALVAWSIDLQTSIKSTMSAGALIGRGSGEAFQVAFNGQGFVIVQPSEGPQVPAAQ